MMRSLQRPYLFLFFCLILAPLESYALMQLQFNFSYEKQIFGEQRENKLVERTYSGALAWFMFPTTAIEVNYTESEQINIYEEDRDGGGGLIVESQQDSVRIKVYGVGLRQALLPLDSTIVPMISAGYAKQFTTDGTTFLINDNGTRQFFSFAGQKKRYDSAFGAFILNIKLSSLFRLNGSVKTVFRAFEWNEAKNNLQYIAGFSWFF